MAFGLTAVLTEMSVLPTQYGLGVFVAIVAVVRLGFLALDNTRLARTLHARVSCDPLTGLPNRSALVDLIEDHGDGPAGLLLIELDPFQAVNHTLGHAAADELLVLVSQRLQYAVRADWEVIALEGDVFVVLNTSVGDPEIVAVTGQRIVERLSLPFHLDGREAWIGVRVGAASTGDDLVPAELLEVAELALRTANSRARGEVVSADADMRRRARDRDELEFGLRHAIDRGEFFALFQPKVDLISGAMVGVEALVRWARPGVGVVPPG